MKMHWNNNNNNKWRPGKMKINLNNVLSAMTQFTVFIWYMTGVMQFASFIHSVWGFELWEVLKGEFDSKENLFSKHNNDYQVVDHYQVTLMFAREFKFLQDVFYFKCNSLLNSKNWPAKPALQYLMFLMCFSDGALSLLLVLLYVLCFFCALQSWWSLCLLIFHTYTIHNVPTATPRDQETNTHHNTQPGVTEK